MNLRQKLGIAMLSVATALYLSSASGRRGQFVGFLRSQKGKPYILGANGPDAYDCASLVQAAYRHIGIAVPDCVTEQVQMAPYKVSLGSGGKEYALTILKPGDCIGFDYDPGGRFDHVGVWTGSSIIHASGGAACPNHPTSRCKVVEDPPSNFSGSSWREIYSYIQP